MAGLRPPLPLRRLDGPARPAREAHEGDGAAGPDRVIVTPPLTNTVRTTSTTQRGVTVGPEITLSFTAPPSHSHPPRPQRVSQKAVKLARRDGISFGPSLT